METARTAKEKASNLINDYDNRAIKARAEDDPLVYPLGKEDEPHTIGQE